MRDDLGIILFTENHMTLEEKPANNTDDDSDSFVDAMAALALVLIFAATAVFWVSQQ